MRRRRRIYSSLPMLGVYRRRCPGCAPSRLCWCQPGQVELAKGGGEDLARVTVLSPTGRSDKHRWMCGVCSAAVKSSSCHPRLTTPTDCASKGKNECAGDVCRPSYVMISPGKVHPRDHDRDDVPRLSFHQSPTTAVGGVSERTDSHSKLWRYLSPILQIYQILSDTSNREGNAQLSISPRLAPHISRWASEKPAAKWHPHQKPKRTPIKKTKATPTM